MKTNSNCWRQQQISKPRKPMYELILNMSRTNTHRSQAYLFQIYHKKIADNTFSAMGEFFKKDRISPKIKQLRYKYRKVLDLGTQSGAGTLNRCFFLRYLQRNMEKIVSQIGTEVWARKYFRRDNGRSKLPTWRTFECTQWL